MKHIRIPLFVWFSIVLLIAVAPVSLSAQESFIQKIEKNKSVSGIKSLDTSRFPEKYVMYLTQPLDHRHPEKGSFRQRVIFRVALVKLPHVPQVGGRNITRCVIN